MSGIVVLWGINTHKCSSCGVRGEWPPNADPPTEEQLAKCPKCGAGPFVALTKEERDEEWDKSSFGPLLRGEDTLSDKRKGETE